MLLDDRVAAGGAQLHFLRLGRLLISGDARIADLSAVWSTGSAILRVRGHPKRPRDRLEAEFTNTEDTDNRSFVVVAGSRSE
jgi:hypothetical protein